MQARVKGLTQNVNNLQFRSFEIEYRFKFSALWIKKCFIQVFKIKLF